MTGTPTVTEPFYFELQKSTRIETILDVEITVPPNRIANIKIRKNDSVVKEVTAFANQWSLNETTFQ